MEKGFDWFFLFWSANNIHENLLHLVDIIGENIPEFYTFVAGEDRWASLRMQNFLMVLIHWEKSVKQPQKQVSEVSKTTFLPIKLQQSIIQAAMYAASANKAQKSAETRI